MPAKTRKSLEVFLSFAPKDQPVAEKVAERLSAEGYGVYPFDLELGPGDNWHLEIGKALERANAMVVFFSPATARWPAVRSEIEYALASRGYENRLFSLVVRPTSKVPWILRELGTIKLGTDREAAIQSLLKGLRKAEK